MKSLLLQMFLSLAIVMTLRAEDKPNDAKDIQGTWLPVKAELRGAPMKDDLLKKIILKLDGGKYEVMAENLDKGTYTINPAVKPRTIDILGTEGPNVGKKIPAIYELKGDTLRICYGLGGGPRPTEFTSPSGTQNFLVTYKRKKG